MKTGFSLIEVIIAAAIASMLSAVLFLSWSQIKRIVVRADNRTSIYDRMMLVRKQFEHDFSGMCVPVSRPYLKPESKEEEKKPSLQASLEPAAGDAKKDKKEKPKPVERVFYAQKKGDMFESLTCLTNNPLQVYWSEKAGEARPRIARIQYRLEQEPKTEKKPSYTLYRQEFYTLDVEPFQKGNDTVRSYVLISGIKDLKMTYWQEWQVQKEAKESDTMNIGDKANAKEGDKKNDEPVKEIKKVTTWDLDKEPAPKNTFIRPIPTMIVIELVLWDLERKKTRSFNIMIPIPIEIENPKKEKKKASPAAPAAPAQPALPALPGLPLKMGPQQTVTTTAAPQPKSIISNLHMVPVPQNVVAAPSNQATLLKDLLKDEKGMNGKHT